MIHFNKWAYITTSIVIFLILGIWVVHHVLFSPVEILKIRHASAVMSKLERAREKYYAETSNRVTYLDQLVPTYFDEIPRDPWGHKYVLFDSGNGSVVVTSLFLLHGHVLEYDQCSD